MPHFVVRCQDGPEGVRLRPLHREAHIAHVRTSGVVRVAGPLVDEGGLPVGSLLVVEVETLAAAQAFCEADPYNRVGVFASIDIQPFRMTFVDLPPDPGS